MSRFDPSFNPENFLKQYWQKSPVLLRQTIAVDNLIDSDELAGLALESSVESRLIHTKNEATEWHLKHGPLTESDFKELPESDWTLLVQAVDHWIPEVRSFMKEFSFIPEWRIDDIMISFATDNGGVGPHFDQYDVFLVQLEGRREWKLGQLCDDDTDLADQMPVKLMTDFQEQDRWTLEPGDILYLPPGFAHWGTSIGNSMTLSVGFRAPSESEIVSEFGHFLSSTISDFKRYNDANIKPRTHEPHRIQDEDIERVQSILRKLANDKQAVGTWLGHYMTEPKYDDIGVETGDWTFDDFLSHWKHSNLFRNASSRIAYNDNHVFVDGQIVHGELVEEHAQSLCEFEVFDFGSENVFTNRKFQHLLWLMLNIGAVYFED